MLADYVTFAEYIWIDGSSPTQTLRSKTKALPSFHHSTCPSDFPAWGFDGSSTGQATGDRSDCMLKPVYVVKDPVRTPNQYMGHEKPHYLVMCEVFKADGTPHPTNTRAKLRETMGLKLGDETNKRRVTSPVSRDMLDCLFGLEQEYTLFKGSAPLGFGNDRRFPAAQGPYYCGVGADEVFGRPLVEAHMTACGKAGLKISGVNAEVMPGQWEFQIGPCSPLEAGDHLWLARWLLYRLGEDFGINATLDPKPVPGDWNGAGMHTNFSTEAMRSKVPTGYKRAAPDEKRCDPPVFVEGMSWEEEREAARLQAEHPLVLFLDEGGKLGMDAIIDWCEEAGKHIEDHLAAYGDGIEMRLTGRHETCSYKQFKYGVSDRTASIRIPMSTGQDGYGYLEDRRPNANACPYAVANVVLKTAFRLW